MFSSNFKQIAVDLSSWVIILNEILIFIEIIKYKINHRILKYEINIAFIKIFYQTTTAKSVCLVKY